MRNFAKTISGSSESSLFRFVLVLLAVGTVFRTVWIEDMEWKGDEKHLFQIASDQCPKAYPPVGIPSSKGVPNPGLSIWLVCAIGEVAHTPVGMVRWVQAANIVGLWGFWLVFRFLIPAAHRLTYLLGLGLFSISLLPVLFSRKLWQQCLLAPFALLFYVGFLFRRHWWGALMMGFVGGLLPQIHMPAAYFLVGVVLLTLIKDLRMKEMRWATALFFALGSAVAAIGFIPWFQTIAGASFAKVSSEPLWRSVIKASFFWTWIAEAFGANFSYPLQHMFITDFAPLPRVFGMPTYLMLMVALGCGGIGLFTLFRLFCRRDFWRDLFGLTLQEDGDFFPKAALLGYGTVLVLACSGMYPHYLIVAYPFVHVWASSVMRDRRGMFLVLVALNLALTASFLVHVHYSPGKAGGEYGVPFRLQTATGEYR